MHHPNIVQVCVAIDVMRKSRPSRHFCSFGIAVDREKGECGMLLERGASSLFHIIRKRRGSSPFTFQEKVSIALQLSLGLQVPSRARRCSVVLNLCSL